MVQFDGGFTEARIGEYEFEIVFKNSFGGSTLSATSYLACLSCPDKLYHSSHAWFLRQMPRETPLLVAVESVKDGRLFSHRRVRIVHEGKALCEVGVILGAQGGGVMFDDSRLTDTLPQPEQLPTEEEVVEREGWTDWSASSIQWRPVGNPRIAGLTASTAWAAWAKPRSSLPDDPAEHAAALAYMTDNHSDWSVGNRIPDFDKRRFASLDNSIWVHRWQPWDDWWFVRARCDVGQDGCTFSRRKIYSREGRLIASAAQEAFYGG